MGSNVLDDEGDLELVRRAIPDAPLVALSPRPGAISRPSGAYAPSWVDRMIDRINVLPGPAWLPYVIVLVVVAAASNAAAWADGYVAPGTLDPYVNSLAVYLVSPLAAIHYLDRAAIRAWTSFRPAAALSDPAAERAGYELTTMPARPTLAWTIVGLAGAVAYVAAQYGAPLDLEGEPITFVGSVPLSLVSFAGAAAFIYHTLRQLRLIGRIHGYVENVDLLHLEPLHAFAGVTASTGILLLGIGYLSVLTDPATFTNPILFSFTIATAGLAIISFVVPLYGIHGRIAAEKSRRLAAVNRRLNGALADLDRRADAGDFADADAFNKHLSSLLIQRDVIARVSTWPWQPETVRGFTTALVLPVALWLVFRFLERQLV